MRTDSLKMKSLGMKSLIAVLGALALAPFAAHGQDAQNFIVSDVDDTVKLTDVLHTSDAIIRATLSRRAFAGMSTLYRELSEKNGNSTLYFVTGSPKFMREPIVSLVVQNKFPHPWMLSLRDLSKSTPEHKIESISEIIGNLPDDAKLILVGDDGEKDPETYATLRDKFPNRITAIYIHRIQAREIPAGEFAYDTALDIATHEMESGRLSIDQALRVGKAVLAEGQADDEKLVMHYNYCPTHFEAASQPLPQAKEIYALSAQIQEKIKNICNDRAEKEAREREHQE